MANRLQTTVVWRKTPGGVAENLEDVVVREKPVTLFLNDEEIVTLLCTPEYLEDLAVGFFASEGMLKSPEEILDVSADYSQGLVRVQSSRTAALTQQLYLKRYLTTGCGKGTSFYNVLDASACRKIDSPLRVETAQILQLMRRMQESSELYRLAGGSHAAALCSPETIVLFREDVGRHNAADKIAGRCFREKMNLADKLLLTSGRISSEILIKVSKMGIPVLVSRSAPTDLAVTLAAELGITLVGFARGRRLNVYAHAERIL